MSNLSKCIFCQQENLAILFQDAKLALFKDIRPAAEHHYLVIPKEHVPNVKYLNKNNIPLLEEMKSFALNYFSTNINNYDVNKLSTNSNFPLQVTNNRSLTKRLPNCIIVGARKCGTRALLEFLDIHPQIRKVTDELHFFDDERKYNLGLDWYLEQMPLSLESDVVIEKTPAYFVTEYVPERIYAMNGSIKIILIVRDPVTRLISDYAQLASNRKAKKARNIESFEELIMLANGKVNSNHKAIRISLYAIYFSRWIKLFSKNQIHVVDGDQFVYDPLSELQKIEDFLGLPSHINRDNFTYNTTKGFYCIRTEDNGQRCLNKNKGRKHPDIHPLVIQKLRRFYDPYNKYFYKLVGRKFAWPG
ncbi:Heparan sulfate glucosamine 3-O-sulfotransferase 5 [Blomia tropicalis]|nr:Heparan sulfate glucosamine 3-O-sulfotransferase 5 [Blomia tropicalis]